MDEDFIVDRKSFESLFHEARSIDEFEFCCTLLRVRGLESPGWDSLEESLQMINQVISLINAPLENNFKLRMSLMIYCHITEMNDFYSIIANLIWILLGKRYSIDPFYFELYPDRKAVNSPEGKVNRLQELSIKANRPEISKLYNFLLVKQVRNAFFHSDYTLHEGTFRIIRGEGVNINGIITKKIPLDWLVQRIEVAINTVLELINLLLLNRMSYTEQKVIKGRLEDPNYCDVTLLVDKNGLKGFRC